MSTAWRNYSEEQFHTFTVAAASAVTRGFAVEQFGADNTVRNVTAADTAIGIAMETAAAGAQVKVYLFGTIVDVLVGTGGATMGNKAMWAGAADGFTNAPASADGDNVTVIFGTFLETGVAGTRVGMLVPGSQNRENA